RAMTYRKYGTSIASLSVLAFVVFAASQTHAEGVARGGWMAPPRPSVPTPHHYLRSRGGYYPAAGGVFYGSPNDEPTVNVVPPPAKTSDDLRYTCVHDIPWDYVHRCPQYTTPRD